MLLLGAEQVYIPSNSKCCGCVLQYVWFPPLSAINYYRSCVVDLSNVNEAATKSVKLLNGSKHHITTHDIIYLL